MEHSGSQKFLKVVSVLAIVVGVLGILAALGMGFLSGATISGGSEMLAETGITAEEQSQVAGVFGVGAIIVLFSSFAEIISGILGIRASNDNQKIMPVWYFSLAGLTLATGSLFSAFMDGSFSKNAASLILSFLGALLMVVVSNKIKAEAGK